MKAWEFVSVYYATMNLHMGGKNTLKVLTSTICTLLTSLRRKLSAKEAATDRAAKCCTPPSSPGLTAGHYFAVSMYSASNSRLSITHCPMVRVMFRCSAGILLRWIHCLHTTLQQLAMLRQSSTRNGKLSPPCYASAPGRRQTPILVLRSRKSIWRLIRQRSWHSAAGS